MDLRAVVCLARERQGVSWYRLARLAEVDCSQLTRWVRRERQLGGDRIERVLTVLGVELCARSAEIAGLAELAERESR